MVSMGIEAAMVTVKDARTEAGQVYLGDPFEFFCDGSVGVLHALGIRFRGHFQDIRSFHRLQSRLAQKFHDLTGPDGRSVHSSEPV